MRKLLILGLTVLSLGCGKKEPLHQGKPASHWVQELRSPDAKARRSAASALAALKAKAAVPDLAVALKDADAGVRAAAAEALWSLGPEARDAVPELTAALADKSPDVRLNAAGALGEIGADVKTSIAPLSALQRPAATAAPKRANNGPAPGRGAAERG